MKISPNSENAISKFKHLFTENISSNADDASFITGGQYVIDGGILA